METKLREAYNLAGNFGGKPQLVLILFPKIDSARYSDIKRIGDTILGVPTQVVSERKQLCKENVSPQFYFNLALKINAKIGGINFVLEKNPFLSETPTIIFGADVTHPGPGAFLGAPSIAAVVASVDDYGVEYRASLSIQTGRMEIIAELPKMVKERLRDYTERNGGKKPRRIIFCRDGVSEGQFLQVLKKELSAIRNACKEFYTKNEILPTITFLVVQKRHHTRFYPTDGNQDESGNSLAGLVVETAITCPYEYDFYLLSHAGLQGTSRPCHYQVLYDENDLSPDKLQKFLNELCYVFARCTRAVSLIPPVYYADIMCTRGRAYVYEWFSEGKISEFKGFHPDVLEGMHFM